MARFVQIALILLSVGCLSIANAQESIVPNVLGLTADDAKKTLSDAGYKFKEDSPILSTFAMKTAGHQYPAGGTKLKKDETVAVRFSVGLWIRDFRGQKFGRVEMLLKSLGIDVIRVDVQAANIQKDVIVAQVPPSSDLFDAKTDLTLRVSVGPWIPAPELVEQSLGQAQKLTTKLNLDLKIVSGPKDQIDYAPGEISGKPGLCEQSNYEISVATMSPPEGALLFPGAVIDITTYEKLISKIKGPCICKGLECVFK